MGGVTWSGPLCSRPKAADCITVDLGGGQIITDTFARVRAAVRRAEQERLMRYREEKRVLLEEDKDGQLNQKTGKWGLKPKPKLKSKPKLKIGGPTPSRSRYYVRKADGYRSPPKPKRKYTRKDVAYWTAFEKGSP